MSVRSHTAIHTYTHLRFAAGRGGNGRRAVITTMLHPLLTVAALGTSVKMDFLPLGSVRTDPLLNPTCLSDHVHTFYGAAASLRPETTYDDMRAAMGNSGNVEENKSLYWHPSVYMVEPSTGEHTLADIWFASAYYVWETGSTQAFPNGFNMIARASNAKSRVEWECASPQPCQRDDCATTSTNFPATACAELEVSFVFPTCWDGVNLVSENMMDHVAYDTTATGRFDGDCPASHPVKLPEIHLYFRIENYPGGQHIFSDGTDIFHADYFSGWDRTELQRVLDECVNHSDAASPDAFCEDYLTFRGGVKVTGNQTDDGNIRTKLEPIQPPPLELQTTVTPEAISNVVDPPRGACVGTLLPASSGSSASTCGGGCVGAVVGGTFVPILMLALWLCGAFGPRCASPLKSKKGTAASDVTFTSSASGAA